MSRGGRLLWLAVAIAVLLLPACRARELTAQTEIDLKSILPPSLEAVDVQRLDPTTGLQPQWLVLYKYDVTERFSPIAGVVYRSDRGGKNQPPVIFPYPLRLPDRDYLGSENVSVRVADVLSAQPGTELVAENRNANEFLTEAAIFRWHDPFSDEVWRAHNLEERHYECMGFFRADGEVIVEMDRVVVKKLVGDRSQLARFYEYQPDDRGSYLPDGVSLKAAGRSWIGFAFGQTGNVLDSPYPEKIVLAFYNSLGGATENLKPFLSQEGQKLLPGLPGYGCAWSPGQVKQAIVHEITYFPGVESQVKEEEAQQALVELKVQCLSKGGDTMPADAHVGWFLKREDGRWKMDQIYQPTR
jgi:hypothetical protein